LENSKSVLVLKKPKTASSIRIAYATPSLIHLLKIRQDIQAKKEETPIDPNYHLIFTQGCDLPPEP
ncbi:MAG: hypothetical protein LBS36_13130, partial [Oscillospiraceae bacterium]|nr:hypothetical protein [Oscillospiraceae bacterium]